ncbi:hypothetical protein CA831_37175, partial [Burkholderia multivorans]
MTSHSAASSSTHAFELSFGATCLDAGHTRFRLWAPASRRAQVELHGAQTLEMTAAGDGWFELVAP